MQRRPRSGLHAVLIGLLLALAVPGTTLAHGGDVHNIWQAWSLDPRILGGLGLLGAVYSLGVRRAWQRAGRGHGVSSSQVVAFAVGWLGLYGALASPLDAAGGHWFSAHMAQHIVLMLIAAPLLALSRPLAALSWGLRGVPGSAAAGRGLSRLGRCPLPLAWALFAGVTWLWHIPALYEAALWREPIHGLEHASFLAAALVFWWAVLHPRGGLGFGASVLAVFTIAVQGGLLSALLIFAPAPWYPAYGGRAVIDGLLHPDGLDTLLCLPVSPAAVESALLADQQLAGAIMWVPSSLIYGCALAALVLRWLRAGERATARGPSLHPAKEEPL